MRARSCSSYSSAWEMCLDELSSIAQAFKTCAHELPPIIAQAFKKWWQLTAAVVHSCCCQKTKIQSMMGVDLSIARYLHNPSRSDIIQYKILYLVRKKIYLVWLFVLTSLCAAYLCWSLAQLMNWLISPLWLKPWQHVCMCRWPIAYIYIAQDLQTCMCRWLDELSPIIAQASKTCADRWITAYSSSWGKHV